MADEEEMNWRWRAMTARSSQPRSRVGVVASDRRVVVPCAAPSTAPPFNFCAVDVPADGNCLFYATWQAARLQGIRHPFGLRGVDHVFDLRVLVAVRASSLLRSGEIENGERTDPSVVGGLISEPNQWVQYTGMIPIMAMAHILQRSIVTLSADGFTSVAPHDFNTFIGRQDVEDPIAIYHCQAGNIQLSVPLLARNHYAATEFDTTERAKLKQFVARYRQQTSGVHVPVEVIGEGRGRSSTGKKRATRDPTDSVNSDEAPRSTKYRASDDERLVSSLEERATTLCRLNGEELRVLTSSQRFAQSSRLALLFFHCCSNDPAAFVHNNESLNGPDSETTVNRLVQTLETPPTAFQVGECQRLAGRWSSAETEISACASCCEILRSTTSSSSTLRVDDLPKEFRYNADEEMWVKSIPEPIFCEFVQVMKINNFYYHLNPELVPDPSFIRLCTGCATNPREVRYSIASGHDYGRASTLPVLSVVASKCITPVRCFGLELLLGGKHTTGHAICFPSDGPTQCARVLPSTDASCLPRVTFLGPKEQWRAKKKKFKCIYELSADAMYAWLRVLQHTHSSFRGQGIVVEDNEQRREEIHQLEALIEEGISFQDGEAASRHETRMVSERFGTDVGSVGDGDVVMSGSAVLKPPGVANPTSGPASIVQSMLEIMDHETGVTPTVIPIQRGEDPVVEWGANGNMIACAFPHLFMLGGKRLPTGTWNADFIKHLMNYYDGRFEQSTSLVALLFNQLQRHTAIQRAARVGVTHTATLKRFGTLVNSTEFRDKLEKAKASPEASESRRLNASLLRVVSLVGGSVPFSPFERAATRPKIAAMRYRYGVPQHWVTLAPPEHDDLLLHRIAVLRRTKVWNRGSVPCAQRSFKYEDLPEPICSDPRARLQVSNKYPALAVSVFESRFASLVEDVLLSYASSNIRVSRHYGQRACGPFGRVAAHCSVVEAQVDGRLHSHSLVYGSAFTPELLTRVSCNARLRQATASWLDSVCTTHVHASVYEWLKAEIASDKPRPRAFQVSMPEASSDLTAFYSAAQRRMVTTNIHAHSTTCHKGLRGKYMCRLARPAGTHDMDTQPLQIHRQTCGNMAKGIRPEVIGYPLDARACSVIDSGYKISEGSIFAERLPGPVVWELKRPPTDTMLVETNLVLGALTLSHTNASVVSGEDAGDMVEQYSQAYMTKDQASLNTAIPVLLSALEHVQRHPSKADDRNTDIRKGRYLASRTVNAFTGANEWPHSVMVFALLGQRSFISSDTFWYIFPRALAKHVLQSTAKRESAHEDGAADSGGVEGRVPQDPYRGSSDQDLGRRESYFEELSDPDESAESTPRDPVSEELDALAAMANNDAYDTPSKSTRDRDGGTRTYNTGKDLVFVSQVESYVHRGHHFADYSPMEFECIVDVLPIREENKSGRGRPARPGFAFASTHPLYGQYEGFIRMKMHTPVFGGSPPPLWKDAGISAASTRCESARYLLSTFVPWIGNKPRYSFDEAGLVQVFKDWDHSHASLVDRQRYRYMRNVLQRGRRSSRHEATITDWRNRSVDLWKDLRNSKTVNTTNATDPYDPEMSGVLSSDIDVFRLLQQIATAASSATTNYRAMQAALTSVMEAAVNGDSNSLDARGNDCSAHGMIPKMYGGRLLQVASELRAMQKNNEPKPKAATRSSAADTSFGTDVASIDTSGLSPGQIDVVKHVLNGVDSNTQTLTMLHGGGGTGKSFVVRRISDEIEKRGKNVISTCPTGAGACQFHHGKTFHAAFKCYRSKHLSAHALELLKLTFDSTVSLVVVDEVSMLSGDLMNILDERLRALYDDNKAFGGMSILLVGDFAQVPSVGGISLCKAMYCKPSDVSQTVAKELFRTFKVMFLDRQQRARDCELQQYLLQTLRALPTRYPTENRWTRHDNRGFNPVTPEVLRAITRPLTTGDVQSDPKWLDSSVIIVLNNHDKAAMNSAMAKLLARKNRVLLFRWRKNIQDNIQLDAASDLLYNEEERPVLFGYFYKDARGQILDNSNGNVVWGVANGTLCRYHSIAWDDDAKTQTVLDLTADAIRRNQEIVDLPFPPDFLNVVLLDRDGDPVSPDSWPRAANLANVDAGDDSSQHNVIVVPIGIVASKGEAFKVKLPATTLHNEVTIHFEQHAVDLAIALTIWKAQGSTFERVILHHEVTALPRWTYERVYVALSRVRAADHLRCLPLSILFDSKKLVNMRPCVFTVKWRMDIDRTGFWQPRSLPDAHHAGSTQ